MEDEKKELEILNEGMSYLDKAIKCFVACDTVTKDEYRNIANYYDILKDRKIELQLEIDGCILEEV